MCRVSDPRVRAAMDRGESASVLLDTRHSRPLCQVLQANSSDRITRAKVAGVVRGMVCVVCALKKSKTPNHLSSQSQEQLTLATLEVVAHITVCNGQERTVINSYRHAAPKRQSTRPMPRRPNLGEIWCGDVTGLIRSRRSRD